MNLVEFLTGLAGLFTGLGTLIAACASLYKAIADTRPSQNVAIDEAPLLKKRKPSFVRNPWFFLGILMSFISISIFVARLLIPAPISVAITNLLIGQLIEVELSKSGGGSFIVSGVSTEVTTANNLRIYVLVHPAEPFAAGWWIQEPAVMNRNGQWTALAWIGNQDFPPQAGDKIDLVIVATEPGKVIGYQKVGDPKDIQPLAQSDVIQVEIGSTK